MSKAYDDGRVSGSPEADRTASGQPDLTRSDGSDTPTGQDGDGTRVELPTRRQMRVQQAQIQGGATVARPLGEPVPGGRRDRRLQLTAQMTALRHPASRSATPASGTAPQQRRIEDMSIQEALAARQAIAADATLRAANRQAGGTDDAIAVDPEVLAQQRALAQRAAALTHRARLLQERSEQDPQHMPALNDPTTPHNLSFLAPPEVVRVPGGSQAVLRAPLTSSMPVVLPRRQPAPTAQAGADEDGGGAHLGAAPLGTDTDTDTDADMAPIKAQSAFGLEPLDAMTAGLGRLRRVRYIQYSLLGVGAAALTTGIIMTVSSLNG